jgi:hypothetical protein
MRLGFVLVTGALAMAAAAPSADAVTTCSSLQTALTGASDGATVDIDSTLVGCSVTLPSSKHVTVRGTTPIAGFDGNSGGAANITGTDVGATVIRDLTFRNSTRTAVSSSGAAISIGGSSAPVLDNDRFFNNKVTGGPTSNGGAVQIAAIAGTGAIEITNSTFGSTAAGQGNSALGSGGGLILNAGAHSARVVNNVFAGNSARGAGGLSLSSSATSADAIVVQGNRFEQNTSANSAGGASIFGSATIAANVFTGNQLTGSAPQHRGAGLFAFADTSSQTVQRDNVFSGNSIVGASTTLASGAGESHTGSLVSVGDHFTGNTQLGPTSGETEGAGLALVGCSAEHTVHLENVVAAGNQIGAGGEGGGLYVGCPDGPVRLELINSTITANQAGAGGTPGLHAGADDTLVAANSIVAGNAGADVAGFATRDVSFSDLCASPGAAAPGPSNICADPALAGAAAGDVHETTASPTIDKGSSALVPATLTTDLDGQPRIAGLAVDMGADEASPAPPLPDTAPPVVSRFSLSRYTFAVGAATTPVAARARRRVPRGTKIRFRLSEAAKVKLVIERKLPGRKVRKRVGGRLRTVCVKPTRALRRKRRCTRYVRAGTLTRTYAVAGAKTVSFSGRIGRRKLKVGKYRLTLTATDGAGNRSRAQRRSFTVRPA